MSLIAEFIEFYTEALVFFGRDEEEQFTVEDLSECTKRTISQECQLFVGKNASLLEQAIEVYGLQQAAIDFYLTRCGHGAGYWDGDLPEELGDKLTVAAKEFGEQDPYLGDDLKVYL